MLDVVQTIALLAASLVATVTLAWTWRDRRRTMEQRQLERVMDAIDELRAAIAVPPSAEKDLLVPRAAQRVDAGFLVARAAGYRLGQTEILLRHANSDDQALSAQLEIARAVADLWSRPDPIRYATRRLPRVAKLLRLHDGRAAPWRSRNITRWRHP